MSAHTAFEFYTRLFDSVIADTEELKRECYRIRHEVYCVQLGHEKPFDEECERDAYDDHAVHGLLLNNETQQYVGTVRLIMHKPGMPDHFLPIHKVCAENNMSLPHLVPSEQIAEISRFCILKSFRRRANMVAVPSMSLGLINVLYRLTRIYGLKQHCGELEPSLINLLARMGIHFEHLGKPVEFHGLRQVCYAKVDAWIERIKSERQDVWEVVTEGGRY